MDTCTDDPVTALLNEWARVSPEFVRWYEEGFAGVTSGGIEIRMTQAGMHAALQALRQLPTGAGDAAAREVLAPYWDYTLPSIFDQGV